MTRATATCSDEIYARHGCVQVGHDPNGIPPVRAYEDVMLAPGIQVYIRQSLTDAIGVVRAGFEVEEIYVRPNGETAFAPLATMAQLACTGEWTAILRRRHPIHEPRVIGIMLAKDEADAIPDVVASLTPALTHLYAYPDDPATKDALLSWSPPGWVSMMPGPASGRVTDGYRQAMLDVLRQDRGDDRRPTWVFPVQGDEVYEDLVAHLQLAQIERATVMTCQVATFVLHESQRDGWDWTQPLAKRFTHYVWDFGEHTGFLDFPWIHYYPEEHMRAFPHGLYPARYAAARPIRRHYPFRTPEQAQARIKDRLKSGWQPHYANYADVFMGKEAAGRPVKRYLGWFPEAERVEGIW